jgi:8-amino-7-oxononanoate synthase
LVCGNLEPYRLLEDKLARFKDKEAAIVFGSGYAANVGTITALVGRGDVVILDKLDHASIIDGARQSGATIRVYPHKNLKKLEDILRQATGRVLIVTETVFSMDGDLAPLAEIVALKEKYGAWLMIDEAHATGLYATNRRGIAEAVGVEDKIDVTLGTLSKALGCAGGFVAGSQILIDYLRNRARSLIYSTALPPVVCAAAAAAVEFVMSDEGHRRRDQLWRNVSKLKNGLAALGLPNESRSPIIPLIIGGEAAAMETAGKLLAAGILVPAIRYPTVPRGKARLRVTVTASHQPEDMEKCLAVVGAHCIRDLAGSNPRSQIQFAPTEDDQPAHQSALRKGRVSLPDECHFITSCVDDRDPVFGHAEAARVVVDSLRWLRDQGRIRLLGFVVMPDHVHVAFALRDEYKLSEVMQSFKRHTSREIHHLVGTNSIRDSRPVASETRSDEKLWQAGFHDHRLRDREDFEKRLAYMHDNPRRAKLATSAEQYPFSTAHPDYQGEIDWAWMEGVTQ